MTAADVPKNVYTILCLIGVEPDEEQVLADERASGTGASRSWRSSRRPRRRPSRRSSEFDWTSRSCPAVDVEEALKPDAPRVTRRWDTNHFWYEGHHCRQVRYGDAAAARAGADHVIEGTYQTSPTEHAPTETTGCIAKPEADGRITVHTNTQALYFSLDNTAIILQIEPSRLPLHRRHGAAAGSAARSTSSPSRSPCLAALKTGRPGACVYTREEEMRVSSTRSGTGSASWTA